MKIITIKKYEMGSRSRWGWHTFRDGKDYKGKIIGFRFLGIGLCWRKKPAMTDAEIEANKKQRPTDVASGAVLGCWWKFDESTWSYDTKCDNKFQFTNDGPKENGFKFCPYCGGQIEIPKESKCEKCNGAGWVRGIELDNPDDDTIRDTMTKYTCDLCGGKQPNDKDQATANEK